MANYVIIHNYFMQYIILPHYSDVIMGANASQITSLSTVYSPFIQAQI